MRLLGQVGNFSKITPHLEQSLGKAMQMLGRYYVQYYSYCYQRTGTLWEGHYKAKLIDSEAYLLTCIIGNSRTAAIAHIADVD